MKPHSEIQTGQTLAEPASPAQTNSLWQRWSGLGPCIGLVLLLTAAFVRPLYSWVLLTFQDDFYSHLLLIPFITVFLIGIRWKEWGGLCQKRRAHGLTVILLMMGCLALAAFLMASRRDPSLPRNDLLAPAIFSYVCFALCVCVWFFGCEARRIAFPLGFLFIMVPLPTAITHWLAVALQHASADAASALIGLTGTPLFRQGLSFHLPGIVMTVAEECSGIRSTLVLFVTSLLASYLFLRTPWKRLILIACVIPLAILRNGLRICTIALLCVHIGPNMIQSAIHQRGGPFFFVLSLIPFFALLFWLRKRERMFEGQRIPPPREDHDRGS